MVIPQVTKLAVIQTALVNGWHTEITPVGNIYIKAPFMSLDLLEMEGEPDRLIFAANVSMNINDEKEDEHAIDFTEFANMIEYIKTSMVKKEV